jgi:hypothetical protein
MTFANVRALQVSHSLELLTNELLHDCMLDG